MRTLSAQAFKTNLASLQLLDIRTPREWEEFNLGGCHLPLDDLLGSLDQLDPKKDYTIVCYFGTQSLVAARLLQAKGFTCHYLEGGLEAYLAL